MFADGCRYHVEPTDEGFQVWDTKTDSIIATKPTADAANNFVDAMETEDDQ